MTDYADLIERLRANAKRDGDDLIVFAAEKLCAEAADAIDDLSNKLDAYRDAADYDATMEGPKFKGWNRSQLDRARKISEASGPHPMQATND